MIPPLDIFKKEKDGTLIWKGAAENLEVAMLSVKTIAAITPGEYEILHHQSGERIVITFDGDGKAQGHITCPKHDTFMVPYTGALKLNRPQGTISLKCANLDTLDASGKLTPYLK